MSLREKAAWISLGVTVAAWGVYFALVGHAVFTSGHIAGHYVGAFLACVVTVIVAQIVLNAAMAITARERRGPADERERLIDLKGARTGFYVLAAGSIAVMGSVHQTGDPATIANVALLFLVLAEAGRCLTQIILFRRAA